MGKLLINSVKPKVIVSATPLTMIHNSKLDNRKAKQILRKYLRGNPSQKWTLRNSSSNKLATWGTAREIISWYNRNFGTNYRADLFARYLRKNNDVQINSIVIGKTRIPVYRLIKY